MLNVHKPGKERLHVSSLIFNVAERELFQLPSGSLSCIPFHILGNLHKEIPFHQGTSCKIRSK